jgi:hypothetical protein
MILFAPVNQRSHISTGEMHWLPPPAARQWAHAETAFKPTPNPLNPSSGITERLGKQVKGLTGRARRAVNVN